jgi:hypothetical protein
MDFAAVSNTVSQSIPIPVRPADGMRVQSCSLSAAGKHAN